MLSRLTLRKHPHLVKLLATYKLDGQYHLIFPYAQSNLRAYWDSTGSPCWNQASCLWFVEQLKGLASGLEMIHELPKDSNSSLHPEAAHPNLALYSRRLAKSLRVDPHEMYGRHGDVGCHLILGQAVALTCYRLSQKTYCGQTT